jgi:hypothetical protein
MMWMNGNEARLDRFGKRGVVAVSLVVLSRDSCSRNRENEKRKPQSDNRT